MNKDVSIFLVHIHRLCLFLNNFVSQWICQNGRYWNASFSWNKPNDNIYFSFLVGKQKTSLKQHPMFWQVTGLPVQRWLCWNVDDVLTLRTGQVMNLQCVAYDWGSSMTMGHHFLVVVSNVVLEQALAFFCLDKDRSGGTGETKEKIEGWTWVRRKGKTSGFLKKHSMHSHLGWDKKSNLEFQWYNHFFSEQLPSIMEWQELC